MVDLHKEIIPFISNDVSNPVVYLDLVQISAKNVQVHLDVATTGYGFNLDAQVNFLYVLGAKAKKTRKFIQNQFPSVYNRSFLYLVFDNKHEALKVFEIAHREYKKSKYYSMN